MELQKRILEQYLNLNPSITLRKIAADTGIQMTRVFRILNGSDMKLAEYEVFRKRVTEKLGLCGVLEELAHECSISLSNESIKEIELMMKRKIQIKNLMNQIKDTQKIELNLGSNL